MDFSRIDNKRLPPLGFNNINWQNTGYSKVHFCLTFERYLNHKCIFIQNESMVTAPRPLVQIIIKIIPVSKLIHCIIAVDTKER